MAELAFGSLQGQKTQLKADKWDGQDTLDV
jgi:hypothetical protein